MRRSIDSLMAIVRDVYHLDPYSNASEVRTLTRQQFRWLLEGLSIDQPKAIHPSAEKHDF